MKRVLCIDIFESPYRTLFYNEISKKYELTVAHSELQRDQKDRDEKWFVEQKRNYKEVQLPVKKIFGKKVGFSIRKLLNKDYDIILIAGYGNLTNIFAILLMNIKKIKFVMAVDGMIKRDEGIVKKSIKSYLLKSASYILSSGKSVTECLISYGVEQKDVFQYPFSSFLSEDINERVLTDEEKKNLKKKLKIDEEKMILSVGQFIPRKGFDVLLKSCKQLKREIGVYLIGGEITEEYQKMISEWGLEKNVHIVGFKTKEELKEYYNAADVFAFPTREDIWGLVVNEAMACGLPVVTTDKCVAGLELIENGKNGYIVPVNNSDMLAEKCNLILENSELSRAMSLSNLEKIKMYCIEKMAEKHIDLFEKIFEE